ncbi:hypothetical protein [Effusibacillus dendaii]|uniref:Phage protein n=1 Tax=Effusibacillus dendaii TaxID=2743772 RepID=A0A7I8D8H2_9BACL|nr:hypothetical protein [Effusibacillus dendaii]BCJ86438.1 hypothetical protein skT53_14230 [Effusibacillus dendaii]
MKMNVMSKAWGIARAGQKKFGGNVKEYFAEALKMAWAESKAPQKALVELAVNNRKGKTWVAQILGKDPQYKYLRNFVSSSYDEDGESGWRLTDGIYEICEVGKRYFIRVANGDWKRIEEKEVA